MEVMKKLTIAKYLLFFTIIGVVGCNTNNLNSPKKKSIERTLDNPKEKLVERTYPKDLDYPLVPFQKLLDNQITPPDSVNIKAFVIGMTVCPPNAECFLGNLIILSDSIHSNPRNTFILNVSNPLQFNKGQKYIFSLTIGGHSSNNSYKILKGYSSLD
jgi:hypothetical protein